MEQKHFLLVGISVLKKCWFWVLIISIFNLLIIIPTLLDFPKTRSLGPVPTLIHFSWILVAYKAHCIILDIKKTPKEFYFEAWGFFFRLVLLGLICFAPPSIFAHLLFGGYFSRTSLLISLFISGIGLLIFSRLATYLPAYIAGINPSINSAFQRGKDNWKSIFGSLMLLNIIIFVTSQIYSKGILGLVKQFITDHPGIVVTKGNDVALLPIAGFSLILTIPVFLILGYSVACGAVILSRAYLRDPSVRLDYNADA